MKILVFLGCLFLGTSALAGGHGDVFSPDETSSPKGHGDVFSNKTVISGGHGDVFTAGD